MKVSRNFSNNDVWKERMKILRNLIREICKRLSEQQQQLHSFPLSYFSYYCNYYNDRCFFKNVSQLYL